MTFHAESYRRPATGGQCKGGADQSKSPRVVASLDPDAFGHLAALAHKQTVPIAEIVRRALAAYLLSTPKVPLSPPPQSERRVGAP